MNSDDMEFWKSKLMAFLHDSPDKCFDIAGHENLAEGFQSGAGFADETERKALASAVKPADWFAAAAERFVFPKVKCSATFAENPQRAFVHPLSSADVPVRPGLAQQAALVHEVLQNAVAGIESDDWRKKHFLYWRRWLENAVTANTDLRLDAADLAFLPADTRIPDHTIWNHMTVTSALAGCVQKGAVRPALLLFQFGPVQEFIAQARSTRDLWAGSYLISWLMAHAMKAVSDRIGPDAIIFPNLRGNGIFDALHRDEIYGTRWADGQGGHDTTWQRICQEKGGEEAVADWLLTPTLPNRFLALVPEGSGEGLARAAEDALRVELVAIGEAVWVWLLKNGGKTEWKARWDAQLAAFPQTAWAVQPWLGREACLDAIGKLPVDPKESRTPHKRLCDMLAVGESDLPEADRDPRYYSDKNTKKKLNNPGILWSAHYALVDAKLAARRNTRDFAAWNNPNPESAVKDSLSGKEECLGDEDFWKQLHTAHPKLFVAGSHRYGAMNLIKRLWCRSDKVPYLRDRLGLTEAQMGKALSFDSVPEIAANNLKSEILNLKSPPSSPSSNPYVAVLALDGDEMGKWVSGAKTPEFLKQLAPKACDYLGKLCVKDEHRLLTPSYHLQFSEALANFSVHKAGSVVREHGGQLVYAGGDDVLALLPATRAIACAAALRAAFRTDREAWRLFPGSRCEVSVGLAIGHQNAPLQMLVREAQRAEKTAKTRHNRSAMAVSLYKRSGEIIEWGCKWEGAALDLMRKVTELTATEKLSGRFPYALAALLNPYALKGALPDMQPVILQEFRHVLAHQGTGLSAEEAKDVLALAGSYLEQTKNRLDDFIGLFLTETFINRSRGEE